MAIEAGRVLNGRYRLIRPVGQGSQASVWVAEHLALTTHVAVKLIDPELAKRDSARERFRREATAAAQLRSAHVVQILDHGIDGDQPFIVMELLDGEDLFERLAHRSRLSLRETSKIVTQVARALSRAHAAGIVHRDLKPENVFLCPNEDDEVVKVLDFGVAKVKDAAKVTMQKTGVGTLIGTPHYMSPEQVKGIGEVDYHADLWALSVIAFQCVTGELPYDSEGVGDLLIKITIGESPTPSKVYPGIHANFDAWYAKAGARDSTKRFQSAREMALALAGVVGAIDGVAPRAPTVRPPAAIAIPGSASLPIPKAPRAMTEQLDAADWEEVDDEDDAPTRMKPPPPVANPVVEAGSRGAPRPQAPARPSPQGFSMGALPPNPRAEGSASRPAEGPPRAPRPVTNGPAAPGPARAVVTSDHDSQDIVDFDATIPAQDLHRQSIALPPVVRAGAAQNGGAERQDAEGDDPPSSASMRSGGSNAEASAPLVPLSEPPRSSPTARRDSGPAALMAPLAITAPRAPVSITESSPPQPPRPPAPPRPADVAPRSAGPMVTPVGRSSRSLLLLDTPPEFDGSRRRRMVRYMVAGLVIFAVGITLSVVRSQIDLSPSVAATPPPPTATAAPEPPAVTAPPPADTSAAATAVDPGKVTHPTKPTPSVHRGPMPRPRGPRPTGDGTIVVPEPDEESVPSAP
jgi:serine/threonine protein kinase